MSEAVTIDSDRPSKCDRDDERYLIFLGSHLGWHLGSTGHQKNKPRANTDRGEGSTTIKERDPRASTMHYNNYNYGAVATGEKNALKSSKQSIYMIYSNARERPVAGEETPPVLNWAS